MKKAKMNKMKVRKRKMCAYMRCRDGGIGGEEEEEEEEDMQIGLRS